MNSGNIGGNLYLNFFMSSFAELIGFAGCLAALHKMGRKPVFAISVLISGAACLLTIFPVLYASTGMYNGNSLDIFFELNYKCMTKIVSLTTS